MNKVIFSLLLLVMAGEGLAQHRMPGADSGNKVLLSNGWSLTPAGRSLTLGDLPLNMAVPASGRWLAVTNNGQRTQTLQLVDVKGEKVVDSVIIRKSWLGLQFSSDDKYLYASGGNDNWILKYALTEDHRLHLADSFILGKKWPEKISPAGLDVDDKRQLLYVVTRENNSLYIIDLASRAILQRLALGGEGYTCKLSR